jgi:hypothetical protein
MPLPHPKLRYAKANKGGRPSKSGGELSSSDKSLFSAVGMRSRTGSQSHARLSANTRDFCRSGVSLAYMAHLPTDC